jgi:alpha-methylacyl-CoA racemase
LRAAIAGAVAARPRAEWDERFRETDACVAPVLAMSELGGEPHHRARSSFPEVDGVRQPAPAPRLAGTPCRPPSAPAERPVLLADVLREWSGPSGQR